MKKNILFIALTFLGSIISNGQSEDKESRLKANSFNIVDKADAYSWISKDGKRIYYTKDDSKEAIWKAERLDLNQAFQSPVEIKIEGLGGNNEIFSSWLTQDESTLYFITRESDERFNTFLYKATYNKTTASFIHPQRIHLDLGNNTIENSIFISGPSLSNDLSELFVYFSGNDNTDRIAYFEGKDGINYTFKSFVNNADTYCPGTLSEDGLSYYLTLRAENNILVKLSRSQPHSEFSEVEYFVIDTLRNHGKNYYQPHVNSDLNILSITHGSGTWSSNDIDIIEFPRTKLKDYKPQQNEDALAYLNDEEYKQPINEELIAMSDSVILPVEVSEINYLDTLISDNTAVAEMDVKPEPSPISSNRIKFTQSLQLYPNPANETVFIKTSPDFALPNETRVEIMDLNGKCLYSEILTLSTNNLSIATGHLKEGIYFCRITTPGGFVENKKFVISRS